MKLQFIGAAGEVGRSCILVESEDTRIMLDAGVKIGEHDEYPLIKDIKLDSIDAIIISHAHLDHSGYLPHLYSSGYEGPFYVTKPTFELINILVSDYLKISEPANVSKTAMTKIQKHAKIVEYHKEFKIKNLRIRFVPAGHILGSAMIEIHDGKSSLLYTGDANFRTTKLLDGGYTEYLNAETLIMESTYGGNKDMFPSEHGVINTMIESIKSTIQNGGKVILPTFGVGRAQEILLILDDYMKSGVLPKVPIYADGMVNKAMRIHRHNVIYCRDELQKRILLNDDDPFKSSNFVTVETSGQRRGIISHHDPCIIVTTSGMLTGGPVLRYLKRLAGDSNNKIIFVGYQASGTRGRQLVEGAEKINIDDQDVDVKLAVESYHLSAHADRQQLLHFVSKIKNLKNIFIVHGEYSKSEELKESIDSAYNIYLPKLSEEFIV